MNKLAGIFFLIILHVVLKVFPLSGQQVDIDSIARLHNSEAFLKLSDSLKADACRRLAIENVRISNQKAQAYAEELYQIALRSDYRKEQAIALNLIGVCNAQAGNIEKALDYYQRSLSVRRQLGDSIMIANTLNNIGNMNVKLGNYEKGFHSYRQALHIRMSYHDSSGIAQSLNNLGVAGKMQGNYDTAMYYFEKSLAIKRRLNDKELIASSLNNMGEIEASRGNNEKALQYFEESLSFRREINDRYGLAKTYSSMSEFMADIDNHSRALRYLQTALTILIPSFADTSLYANPRYFSWEIDHNVITLLQKKADILRTLYKKNNSDTAMLRRCFDTHAIIIDFIEQIRKGYEDEKSKLYLASNYRSMYSDAITLAVEMFTVTFQDIYKARAFEFAELGKARVLLDLITENDAKISLKIPDSLIVKESSLKKDIALLQKYGYDEKENPMIADSVQKLIFDKKRQLRNFEDFTEENYPEYVNLKYKPVKPTIAEVQNKLTSEQLYIQYHVADTILQIFILTTSSNNIITVELKPDFNESIEKFRTFFTNGLNAGPGTVNPDFCYASFRLYDYLVKPVVTYFRKKELIIIPDGQLFYIPFEVLLTTPPDSLAKGYSQLPYLVREYPVTYSYSASMFLKSFETGHNPVEHKVAVFARSFKRQSYTYSAQHFTKAATRNDRLSELPGVTDEVNQILKIVPGDAFIDSLATEFMFKNLAGKYLGLHIATHGIIDNEHPMYSKLLFAADSLHNEDGDLYVWELFNMEMSAEMAVLSACNTGFGKLHTGEGVMTLARGFMFAGVPSLLISLWDVNDESTAAITAKYYFYLKEGDSKHVALQKAKIDYLASGDDILSNPYFWGGFVHLGNTNAVSFENPVKKRLTIAGFILAGLMVAYFCFKMFRKIRSTGKGSERKDVA